MSSLFKKSIQFFLSGAFFSYFFWTLLNAVNMADSWEPRELWVALFETSFGHLCCASLGIYAVLYLLSFQRRCISRRGLFCLLGLSLTLPLFSVFSGHAATFTGHRGLRIGLALTHSFSAAIWSGGLVQLSLWLAHPLTNLKVSTIRRFSHFAMVSTALVVLSGGSMTYLAGISIFSPLHTEYGKWIAAKSLLFFLALGAAAINQFIHLRNAKNHDNIVITRSIRREVRFELKIVIFIFLLAGFLTRTSL